MRREKRHADVAHIVQLRQLLERRETRLSDGETIEDEQQFRRRRRARPTAADVAARLIFRRFSAFRSSSMMMKRKSTMTAPA